MARRSARKRKSLFVDEQAVRRARKVFGVTTDAEVVRLSVARVSEMDWDSTKRRDFQNDALIGLTARRHGATVVTADRRDFELLAQGLQVAIFPA